MPLLPRPSSKALEPKQDDRLDPTLPVILEYQSPSSAIINMPMPRLARNVSWTLTAMVLTLFVVAGTVKVDKVVTAPGVVISKSPTIVVQPLETAIVRSIDVHVGEVVHAGQVVARLDPTFAAADATASAAQVSQLQAQTLRMQAELENRPFTYNGTDPNMAFQAAVYAQRQSEYNSKLENYREKFDSLRATIARARSDEAGYQDRLAYARQLEQMRLQLEKLNVGSKLNTLSAMDTRAEMQRYVDNSRETAEGAQRDLAALVAERNQYIESWHNDVAQQLTDVLSKLSDARESLAKNQLRRQLVELRADTDGTVMTIAKVSVGSVLQPGQEFITLVPTEAPLEIEANISGDDDGHVNVGDPVDIKFDTFPYTQYGLGHGVVRIVSPDSFSAQDEVRNPTGSVPVPQQNTGTLYYRSRITLDQINLRGVPANFHLIPGMPVHADIRVGKQTVLRYLMGKTIPLVTEGMREP
ncbi:MAG TPA: HlyD family type I secretion periplasmic adaptor subunit [Rhodopila sp.]|uniref:HlyD family type I secretion periplasmic adaptor subunit n=1 Tax=Rhodopila sp. TaxID=2480087 RepID=UPI002CADF8AB|nr:HlyD family type I secretion periplasmic adaptor subunit [Rhodopila sp.]HVY16679.1 HlyD family type I secretion periplasmic adaptor subunit [Rhodopila sp.]